MNLARYLCFVAPHRFSRWSYNKITRHGIRRCKRCGLTEDKALPPLKGVA